TRHAQPHARLAADLSRGLVAAETVRQCRPVDLGADLPRRARCAAGGAISRAGQGDIRLAHAPDEGNRFSGKDKRSARAGYFGHGSAVLVAASIPTKPASAVGCASFNSSSSAALISASSPSPLNTSPE